MLKDKFNLLIIALILTITVASLGFKATQPTPKVEIQTPIVTVPAAPHFEYAGVEGPQNWATIADQYKECASKVQTPIDIKSTETVTTLLPAISFNYIPQRFKVSDNGHTIVYTATQDSSITVNNKKSKLVQFHYHIPSEHEIDNKKFKMEIHFVNKSEDGNLSVVGVFLTSGQANLEFDKLISVASKLPVRDSSDHLNKIGESEEISDVINVNKLLPSETQFFNYTGSLTTPPCTAGVNWLLFNTPITVAEFQIAPFAKKYDSNARPIQPTNGRIIYSNK